LWALLGRHPCEFVHEFHQSVSSQRDGSSLGGTGPHFFVPVGQYTTDMIL